MIFPYPHELDRTQVVVNITKGMTDDGEPQTAVTFTGKCRFKESATTVRNTDGKLIQLSGKVTIGKDIAPSVELLEGDVQIGELKFKIYKGSRPRNPDGTVHHTALELI